MFGTCYGRTNVLRTARRRGEFFSKGLFLCKSGAGTTAPAPMCRYLYLPIQQQQCVYSIVCYYVCTILLLYVCVCTILLLLCMYVYSILLLCMCVCMYVYVLYYCCMYVCVVHCACLTAWALGSLCAYVCIQSLAIKYILQTTDLCYLPLCVGYTSSCFVIHRKSLFLIMLILQVTCMCVYSQYCCTRGCQAEAQYTRR